MSEKFKRKRGIGWEYGEEREWNVIMRQGKCGYNAIQSPL